MKKYRSLFILILSIILGSILGYIFGPKINFLKPLGDIFLNLMFTIVVPLIFFTVTSSICNIGSTKKIGRLFKYIFIVFIFTSLISSLIMFVVLKVINPITSVPTLTDTTVNTISISEQIVRLFTVSDFTSLFSRSNIMPLIIFSIIFSIALLKSKNNKTIIEKLNVLSETFMKLVKIIMYYAPIGLCAYFACLVGEYGSSVTFSYLKNIIIYFIVSIIYMIIMYTLYSYLSRGKMGIKTFWRNIIPSIFTSLATQSSLATLPVNIDVADEMDIEPEISKVALPLGSTMHMEGSSMGAVLKIMFLFSILNIPLNLTNILIMLLISVLSAVVMAGIPAGGLIGEMLIVSLFGFPASAFIPIATIGILIDAPATMLNAVGDIPAAMLIEKLKK